MEDTILTLARRLVAPLKSYFLSFDSTYQTGTWTPTYIGATTPGTTTYTVQVGSYTRVGRVVHFTAYMVWTAATGTGLERVGGLPFTAVNTTNLYYAVTLWHYEMTFANTGLTAFIAPNTNYIQFNSPVSNAIPSSPAVEAAGQVMVTGSYFIA